MKLIIRYELGNNCKWTHQTETSQRNPVELELKNIETNSRKTEQHFPCVLLASSVVPRKNLTFSPQPCICIKFSTSSCTRKRVGFALNSSKNVFPIKSWSLWVSTCSTILLLFSGIIDTSISFYTLSLATMHCFVFDDALLFFFDLFGVEYGILLHIYC